MSFWTYDCPIPEHIIFVKDENDDDNWCGLEDVLNAALDAADKDLFGLKEEKNDE